MKVIVDSNIFLNVMNHEAHEKSSYAFLKSLGQKNIGFISSVQIPEIYKSVFNAQDEEAAISSLGYIKNIAAIIPCTEEIAFQAASIYQKYKRQTQKFSIIDAIIVGTALNAKADFLVTRDPDFDNVTEVKAKKPENILQ